MRNGRMVVLVDAEERENEGDLVIPAQMATPDADQLHGQARPRPHLPDADAGARRTSCGSKRWCARNDSRNRTAFTQSIEAREGISTGISAHDRARTIATAIDPTKGAADIVSPGPRVPARRARGRRADPRRPYRSLRRSRAACRALSGRRHLRDHERRRHHGAHAGSRAFAQRHGLKIGAIEDLIAYRLQNDRLVRAGRQDARSTRRSAARSICTSTRRRSSRASTWRSSRATSRRRARCSCACTRSTLLGDLLGIGEAGEGGRQIEHVAARDREGRARRRRADPRPAARSPSRTGSRGARAARQAGRRRARAPPGRDRRRLADPRDLGVSDMVLLTNSPAHVYVGLEGFGLRIVGTRRIE